MEEGNEKGVEAGQVFNETPAQKKTRSTVQ